MTYLVVLAYGVLLGRWTLRVSEHAAQDKRYLEGYNRGWHLRGIAECADRPRMLPKRDDGRRLFDDLSEHLEQCGIGSDCRAEIHFTEGA